MRKGILLARTTHKVSKAPVTRISQTVASAPVRGIMRRPSSQNNIPKPSAAASAQRIPTAEPEPGLGSAEAGKGEVPAKGTGARNDFSPAATRIAPTSAAKIPTTRYEESFSPENIERITVSAG